jgi:hypothetical protein
MTPDQELWGVALWVEKQHGAEGPRWIGEQAGRLALTNDADGVAMWRGVEARFERLARPH